MNTIDKLVLSVVAICFIFGCIFIYHGYKLDEYGKRISELESSLDAMSKD